MYATTDKISPPQSAVKAFLFRPRKPAWMRARIGFNIFRVFIGLVVLAQLPWAGPIALVGIFPLAWAAVSSAWIYYVQHRADSTPASSAAR
jgi:hypothetical protein